VPHPFAKMQNIPKDSLYNRRGSISSEDTSEESMDSDGDSNSVSRDISPTNINRSPDIRYTHNIPVHQHPAYNIKLHNTMNGGNLIMEEIPVNEMVQANTRIEDGHVPGYYHLIQTQNNNMVY